MVFVLSGVETNNKGAELMLYAILQEIERRDPKAIVYVQPDTVHQGLDYLKTTLTLKEKPVVFFHRFCIRFHLCRVMQKLFGPDVFFDIYAVRRTKYFFDASGYFYTDKWNLPSCMIDRRNHLLANNHKLGAKIIFLPQAFGPITQPNVIEGVRGLQKYADVVMPREKTSLEHLRALKLIDEEKVKLYPDFTCLVDGVVSSSHRKYLGGVCLIPNVRMLDKVDITYEEYLAFFQKVVEVVSQNGYIPFFLNHEGCADENLILRLQRDLNISVDVLTGLNALEVKGVISQSYLIITSRFHGAASALNTGVPCLSTSWGHKYEELFNDYGQNDCVLSVGDLSMCEKRVSYFLEKDVNASIRKTLRKLLPYKQEVSRDMWNCIWALK